MRPDRSHAARRWWVVVWLPLLAISAAAVWYFVAVFVPQERSAAIEVWRGRLSAMADDRKAAITSWLGHRLGDAKVVAEYPTLVYLLSGQHTEPYLFPPAEGPRRHVQRLLDSMQGAHGYRAAYVLDAGGSAVLASTGSPPLEPACRASVARVLSLGHPEVDLHAHADGLPVLAITAPVRVADRTVGAVLLSDDPARWLYPLLLSEPIPTRTGESLLARQVGDQIEFLSPLRHHAALPLSFRVPMGIAPVAAAAAIRGEEGFKQYVDYRGVRVLGAARRIPGTGWGLVVKVDEDEAFSAFRRSVREVALAWACVLLALAGLGFGAWRTQAASYRSHLGESEARFAILRDHANDAILFATRDGVILDVNRKAEESYVRRREELLGLPFDELRAPEERAALRDRVDALARDDELVFEAIHRRSDGTRFPVEVSIRVTEIRGQDVLVSIVRDMTERNHAEEALREAEERFRIASETSNDVVYEWDLKQSVQWFGKIDEMLGYGPGEFPRTLDGWAASVHPEDLERVTAAVRAHLEKHVPYALEYRVRRQDGAYRWWTARGAATRTPDGRPVRWIGTITDITERKRVEEALRESEDRFKYVFEHSILGKSLTRPTGEIQVNRAFAEMLGYSPAEMTTKRWQEISHPDDVADTQRVVDSLLSGEREFARFTKRYIHKNGSVVWGDVATSVRRDKTGAPMYFMTAVSDITERRKKEAELAAAQQLYRELFESVNIGILRSMPGPEGAFIDVNPAMVKMFEANSREQLLALHPSEIYWDGSQRKIVSDAIVAKGFVEEEVRFKTLKGNLIWCHINGVRKINAGGRIYFDSTIEDITERKRAEETVQEARDLLNEVGRIARIGGWKMDLITRKATWTQGTYDIVEIAPGKPIPGPDEHVGYYLPEYRPRVVEAIRVLIEDDQPLEFEAQLRTAKGNVRWVRALGRAVRKGGKAFEIYGTFQDITERKRAEEAMRESEERFRSLYENSTVGLYRTTPDGRILMANPTLVDMLGYASFDELASKNLKDDGFQPSDPRAQFLEAIERDGEVMGREAAWTRADGSVVFIRESARAIRDSQGNTLYYDGSVENITERKRAEEEIRRLNTELEERVQQRTAQLEAANKELEAFSFSVSHDLRAPLRAIDGFSRIVMDDYGDRLDDEGKRQLDVIRANTQKMGRLIDDLLAFSRAGRAELHRTRITMSQLVHAAFSEVAPSPLERGRIDLSVGELPDAWADPGLMRQVWVNLLSNAVKFSRPRERAVIHVTGALEDARVVYHVSDNGVGFDMRYVQKLFGVFQRLHTSREFEGTGVGLALAQRIVHRHGGEVWAEGVVDSGATFSFALPREGGHE